MAYRSAFVWESRGHLFSIKRVYRLFGGALLLGLLLSGPTMAKALAQYRFDHYTTGNGLP